MTRSSHRSSYFPTIYVPSLKTNIAPENHAGPQKGHSSLENHHFLSGKTTPC